MTTVGKVNVLGMIYTVMDGPETEVDGVYGRVNHSRQEIVMYSGCTNERYQETLLHEVMHAVDYELKLGLTEDTVTRLSQGLYATGVRAKTEGING